MSDCQSSQLRLTTHQSRALSNFLAGRGLTCHCKPVEHVESGPDPMAVIVVYADSAADAVTEWQRLPEAHA